MMIPSLSPRSAFIRFSKSHRYFLVCRLKSSEAVALGTYNRHTSTSYVLLDKKRFFCIVW